MRELSLDPLSAGDAQARAGATGNVPRYRPGQHADHAGSVIPSPCLGMPRFRTGRHDEPAATRQVQAEMRPTLMQTPRGSLGPRPSASRAAASLSVNISTHPTEPGDASAAQFRTTRRAPTRHRILNGAHSATNQTSLRTAWISFQGCQLSHNGGEAVVLASRSSSWCPVSVGRAAFTTRFISRQEYAQPRGAQARSFLWILLRNRPISLERCGILHARIGAKHCQCVA